MRVRLKFLAMLAAVALPMALSVGLMAAHGAPTLSNVESLGKAIFSDENLSANMNQSCASCHAPEAGWVGPTSAVNLGGAVYEGSIPGAFGDRKPPSAAYATQAPILHMPEPGEFVGGNFWDGRATGQRLGNPAAEQAQGPFLNPKEQALPSAAEVVARICAADYGGMFREVWGAQACDPANVSAAYDDVGYSVAAYEASAEVNAFSSKFDAKRAGLVKFTKEETKGWSLFKGKAKCELCHIANGPQPLFTDYTYDNLGMPQNPVNPAGVAPAFVDKGLGTFLASRPEYAQYAEENYGKFKVPTLRNVDLRPAGVVKAYGHNGYFKSLEAIVHFYNTRDVLPACGTVAAPEEGVNCWSPPEYGNDVNDEELGNLRLSAEDEANIVAFLKTLSDGYVVPVP